MTSGGNHSDKEITQCLSVSNFLALCIFKLVGEQRSPIVDQWCWCSHMAGRQAKILCSDHLDDLLSFAGSTRNPLRNRVIVLLSVKAGLRAGEIANLTWDMVTEGDGRIGTVIELRDWAAKKGSGRSILIHADLASSLIAWRQIGLKSDYIIASQRGAQMVPLSIVVWFNRAFKNIDLEGCSSHGRRPRRTQRTLVCGCGRRTRRRHAHSEMARLSIRGQRASSCRLRGVAQARASRRLKCDQRSDRRPRLRSEPLLRKINSFEAMP
jgi:integrase